MNYSSERIYYSSSVTTSLKMEFYKPMSPKTSRMMVMACIANQNDYNGFVCHDCKKCFNSATQPYSPHCDNGILKCRKCCVLTKYCRFCDICKIYWIISKDILCSICYQMYIGQHFICDNCECIIGADNLHNCLHPPLRIIDPLCKSSILCFCSHRCLNQFKINQSIML
jgi:hypothetical protein